MVQNRTHVNPCAALTAVVPRLRLSAGSLPRFDKPEIYHIWSASDHLVMSLFHLITIQKGDHPAVIRFEEVRAMAPGAHRSAAVRARDARGHCEAARTANR